VIKSRMASGSSDQFDWDKCVVCQLTTDEKLQCPANSKRSDVDVGVGYETFAKNIEGFQQLGCTSDSILVPATLLKLASDSPLAELFKEHQAKWHKNCKDRFNNTKLQRALKRQSNEDDDLHTTKATRRSCGSPALGANDVCFFCGTGVGNGDMRKVSTFSLDQRVRNCARILEDTLLLGKLSSGDMVAQDALYHINCLTALYKKADKAVMPDVDNERERQLHGIILAELVCYITEAREDCSEQPLVLKLADLVKMYLARMEQLGLTASGRIHSTKLKNRILVHFPDMQAHKQGRDVYLAFQDDIALAMNKAYNTNYDDEAIILAKAANIVRRDINRKGESQFSGEFTSMCQELSVPQSLSTLVAMVLDGPNIASQSSSITAPQSVLTLAQIICYNTTIHRRKGSTATFHTTKREPPLPIYIGLLLHAKTRKRGLVERMHELGLSISYDRVLQLSTDIGNSVCDQFEKDQLVCPPKLRGGLFTTGAFDNIDHNPSSTTATGSLHGTGISLFQHTSADFAGHERDTIVINPNNVNRRKTMSPLPDAYTTVAPVVLREKEPAVPELPGPFISESEMLTTTIQQQYTWLDHVSDVCENSSTDSEQDMKVSWAAFHASKIQPTDTNTPIDISALLPLFADDSKSPAMIKHAMNIIKTAVDFLNPGQVPVIACDQPLFAVAKIIQWNFPQTHGEDNFLIMFGGLHIEMAALKTLGDWLEGSGWTAAITEANIASSGTADSFIKAAHVSRTLHAHEVTACALYILMKKSYSSYTCSLPEGADQMTFDEWKVERSQASPQFHYWSITLDFELDVLSFVQSLRQGNFQLYKDALTKIIPWFLALDHHHYSRWLPVHLRDMLSIGTKHPQLAKEFEDGNFVVHKTGRAFSGIPIDQAHEQNNKCVKGDGGAIGLTENTSELLRWMVAGPEIARLIAEFEAAMEEGNAKAPDLRHHEQVKSIQSTFEKQVLALVTVIETMGNPFIEDSPDLLVLDTRDIVDQRVVDAIRKVQQVGKDKFASLVNDRIDKRDKSLFEPICHNKLPLFHSPPERTLSHDKQQINALKKSCALFSQLYISCQVRGCDLDDFFRHENQPSPPALAQYGQMCSGTKSDLATILEASVMSPDDRPNVEVLLLDGAVAVNLLKPGACKTFQEYGENVFLKYVTSQLHDVSKRLDIVWDEYIHDSLKSMTRSKRGKGVRRRVEPNNRIPGNWNAFLRVDENKAELFRFLAELSIGLQVGGKQVISTRGQGVVCNSDMSDIDILNLSPCSHEEADTRILLHAAECAMQGFNTVMIRTVDTDVMIIAISMFQHLGISELWIAFGSGKNFRYVPIHEIANQLGPTKARSLIAFHAFTGCDQTSSFAGRGKNTAWATWKVYDEITSAFVALSSMPTEDRLKKIMPEIERFVALMYDRTSTCTTVNEARKDLFTRKGRSIENIPPTYGALVEHTKRVAYQAGYCWGQSLTPDPTLPSPAEWDGPDQLTDHGNLIGQCSQKHRRQFSS